MKRSYRNISVRHPFQTSESKWWCISKLLNVFTFPSYNRSRIEEGYEMPETFTEQDLRLSHVTKWHPCQHFQASKFQNVLRGICPKTCLAGSHLQCSKSSILLTFKLEMCYWQPWNTHKRRMHWPQFTFIECTLEIENKDRGWHPGKLTGCEDNFACLVWPCWRKFFL